jgi:hypothetical protein
MSTRVSAWERLAPVLDLCTPMALRVAATLRLADLIADGASDVDTLATRADCAPDALGRMLRLLVARGVFTEPRPGVFGLNETAELLLSSHPEGMRTWLDLDGFGGRMDLAFTGLLHTVRTGEPAWESVFGRPFWEYLDAEPAVASSFDEAMSVAPEHFADVLTGHDWSSVRHVVDVGGGDGMLLGVLLRAHPDLRATLVDLPDTVGRAGRHLGEPGVAGRCSVAAQSFFDPLPTGGDVYVLRRVLHDWGDADATRILANCARAAGERGSVLIMEVHGSSGADPAPLAEMNLRMLVLCGGRERSVAEYGELAASAGLRVLGNTVTEQASVFIQCEPLG